MHFLQRGRWTHFGRWGGVSALLLMLLLAACSSGSSSSTPTPIPGGSRTGTSAPTIAGGPTTAGGAAATAAPGGAQSTDKIDNVFIQLATIYQTQGLDAARVYATDQGLMTKQNE